MVLFLCIQKCNFFQNYFLYTCRQYISTIFFIIKYEVYYIYVIFEKMLINLYSLYIYFVLFAVCLFCVYRLNNLKLFENIIMYILVTCNVRLTYWRVFSTSCIR